MKASTLVKISLAGFLALSACAPATPMLPSRPQSAGPLTVALDGTKALSSEKSCDSEDGRSRLSEIGEGADALFQILLTDPGDLNTIHERADRLAALETEFQAAHPGNCDVYGISAENTAARIEKLGVLAKETDSEIVRALAKEIWDLFNPGLQVRGDAGKSAGNPFSDPNSN